MSAPLAATDLRGRVVRNDPYRTGVPAEGVRAVLLDQNQRPAGNAVSGADGFYYLYNVRPGIYQVEFRFVNLRTRQEARKRIGVTVENRQSQDIPLVTLEN
ncbi:MAG: carboxypeptidase regulatory-like domain-containing protein [Acidobacteria bacterium]|nr:carboxypeptidase regulatory-like domain-containing protein [Acidobacteriota bacterium]